MQVMPVSVLIDICKAIEGDEHAMEQAQQQAVTIIPPFSRGLSKVIMHISDTEVRRWALGEIGVVDDAGGIENDRDATE